LKEIQNTFFYVLMICDYRMHSANYYLSFPYRSIAFWQLFYSYSYILNN